MMVRWASGERQISIWACHCIGGRETCISIFLYHHKFWKKYWITNFRLRSIIHYSFLQYSLFITKFCPVKIPSLQNSAKLLSQWPWGTKFFCKIVDILLQKLTSHCRTVLCVLRPASRIQKRISLPVSYWILKSKRKVSVSQDQDLWSVRIKRLSKNLYKQNQN